MTNQFITISPIIKVGQFAKTLTELVRGVNFVFKKLMQRFYFIARVVKRRCYIPIFNVLAKPARRCYDLINHEDFISLSNSESITLYEQSTYVVPRLQKISSDGVHEDLVPAEKVCVMPVSFIEAKDLEVDALSNIFYNNHFAVAHNYFVQGRDYTSEELHNKLSITSGYVYRPRINHCVKIDTAAVFLDSLSSNYAHWMTEVLTRIAVFDSIQKFKKIPILIDDTWHPNMLELFNNIFTGRVVYQLTSSLSASISNAVITSSCGYVPFERRPGYSGPISSGIFSLDALKTVRSKLLKIVQPMSANKVYIKRESWGRNALNQPIVDDVLKALGFKTYDPSKLSIVEQLSIFASAEVIYSNSGAALANIVCCKPECRIYISIPDVEGTSYHYWNKIAMASGSTVQYLLETPESNSIHSDFCVNTERLKRVFHHE